MRNNWQTYTLVLLLTAAQTNAQEVVTGLLSNKVLETALSQPSLKSTKGTDTLSLPFTDDFSGKGPYPSSVNWSDRNVFINNTFSVKQVTRGIATFDCLDEYGKLYDEASAGIFLADELTSSPLDLNLTPQDSIYFSFLYEAGGIADMPEEQDSLTLSFWSPAEERWCRIWRAGGEATDGFRQVMIPVKNTRYLAKGFRFRFTGYASLSGIVSEPSRAGNADQWNIDYVRLDKGRTVNDTVFPDAAMTLPLRSLLKGYEAMPWYQFKQASLSLMGSTIPFSFRNNAPVVLNVTRSIEIKDVKNLNVYEDDLDVDNALPMSSYLYNDPLIYTYSSTTTDSAIFLVTAYMQISYSDPKQNDTISYLQRFTDYFAIDDGTAEAGYGINGQGARNAMAALRFRSYLADSVAGISICFNDAYNNANQRGFDIMVWADNNGVPGTLLGTTEGPIAKPGTNNNGFVTCLFDEPVKVNGIFWVGWKQLSETFLNTGLDMNTLPQERQYYWLNGNWQKSLVPGTIMIRPVMTGGGSGTGINDNPLFNDLFIIYPNPSSGELSIKPSGAAPEDFVTDIFNLQGALVRSLPRSDNHDVSDLPSGIYMVLVKTKTGKPLTLLRMVKIN